MRDCHTLVVETKEEVPGWDLVEGKRDMGPAKAKDDVEIASEADLEEGQRQALLRLNLSYEELAEMAKRDEFPSEEARLVWFMISPETGAIC